MDKSYKKPLLQVITNAPQSGANPWGCADYLNHRDDILETGVDICEWNGSFSMHTKTILIDDRMTAELQKIGTNINQIAKRVNATGTLYAQDIEDIKGAMAEIWQLQRSILSKAP